MKTYDYYCSWQAQNIFWQDKGVSNRDYLDEEAKNKMIIEDTKGYKNQVYLIKRKMMMYKGFEIIEI